MTGGAAVHSLRFAAMGTRVEAHLFGDCDADTALAAVRAVVGAVEASLTRHRTSPLTTLNARLTADGSAAIDDALLLDALALAAAYHALTRGLFDAAFGGTGSWADVELDIAAARVRAAPGVAFDFGGMGKGFALDRLRPELIAAGVRSALVSLGESSILALGAHPHGDAWPLAIPHPRERSVLADLTITDSMLSVSSTATTGPRAPVRHGEVLAAPGLTVAVDASGARAEALSTALLLASPAQRAELATRSAPAELHHFQLAA